MRGAVTIEGHLDEPATVTAQGVRVIGRVVAFREPVLARKAWTLGHKDQGHQQLRDLGMLEGASVFGIAASRPDQIAQDVPAIARIVDYVSPMVHPSHWKTGEYGVADPNRQPYDIVKASLADFQRVMAATGKPIVPWLQDFDDGVPYGAAEVAAQVKAGTELGITDWLPWNPNSVYTVPVAA